MPRQPLPSVPQLEPDLFGHHDGVLPQGLRTAAEFVTEQEERGLIEAFGTLPLALFQFGAFEGKRRVASYGLRYDYSDKRIHTAEPIPEFVRPFAARAEDFAGVKRGAVQHVLFTEYGSGAGIGWHRDKAAFDMVLGISLGSACPFRFRRREGDGWRRFTLDAAARSIYLMSGEARSAWEHSIAPVSEPRWSITFRTMVR